MERVTRAIAFVLLLAGVAIAGYMIWTLWLTGLSTDRAQGELQRRWAQDVGAVPATPGAMPAPDVAPTPGPAARPVTGDAYAVLWFARPGRPTPPVHVEPLYIVEGVGRDALRAGPGHYPRSDAPGELGNFAVAGHRTTYGAPFLNLDHLQGGDLIHVVDTRGQQWTYEVVEQRIVGSRDTWVLGPDALGADTRAMTLTTCHPMWSATRRLVVFAALASPTPLAPVQ
jgi:sortase A